MWREIRHRGLTCWFDAAKEEEQQRARASLEGWVAEVGGAGLSGVG